MSTDKFIVICFFLAAFIPPITANWISNVESVNGGVGCATCSILLGLVDKLTIVYNETASESLERFCNFLPGQYKVYCKAAIEFLGKNMFHDHENATASFFLIVFISIYFQDRTL